MTRPVELPDTDDFIRRYQSGVSLKQLSEEIGVSRDALGRILRINGVVIRNRSAGMLNRWAGIRERGETDEIMRAAWAAADATNDDTERKVVSLYRSGLVSQALIAGRLGIAKPTVGGILRKNGISANRRSERRAHGNAGGFNPAMQTAVEPALADEMMRRGMDYIHQHAIGTRNVDFGFPQSRVAVEIVRRHWNDAKSLRRQRLEQIFGAGWRLLVIYDPRKLGVDVSRCAEQLVALLNHVGGQPAPGGQYGVMGGDGQPIPGGGFDLHQFSRIGGF